MELQWNFMFNFLDDSECIQLIDRKTNEIGFTSAWILHNKNAKTSPEVKIESKAAREKDFSIL